MKYREVLGEELKDLDNIIIYGAGVFGEFAYNALQKYGITPVFFCDRLKEGQKKHNVDIIHPDDLIKYREANILIAVGAAFYEVYRLLLNMGCENVYSILKLFNEVDMKFLSQDLQDVEHYKKIYMAGNKFSPHNDVMDIMSVDYVITERCTLKCKDCANLMQYYKHPKDYDFKCISKSFDNFLKCVNNVLDLRIIGGEPFMYKNLNDVIAKYLPNNQILMISIFTNATILPNENLLNIMKNSKVRVVITDYKNLSKNTGKFIELMKKHKIFYTVTPLTDWQDLGGIDYKNYTEKQVGDIFENCDCSNILTFLKGKLYLCPFSAHGANLQAMPDDDYIDFDTSNDIKIWQKDLKELLYNKKFLMACKYCKGRNVRYNKIKPAIQAKSSLEFIKLNNPLVSIIMTNYNYDKFIAQAIEGVLQQTYENFEFIIVDDGSTDLSRDIIKEYADKNNKIKYVFKENGGQCHSFNKGYEISKGEIIALLDSDDYYYPEMIERKVKRHEEGGIVDSALTADGINPMMPNLQQLNWSDIFREWGYFYSHNNTSGLSFSRKSIDRLLPIMNAKSIYGALDRILLGLAMINTNVVFDHEVCGFYRRHNINTTEFRDDFYKNGYKYVVKAREYTYAQLKHFGIKIEGG